MDTERCMKSTVTTYKLDIWTWGHQLSILYANYRTNHYSGPSEAVYYSLYTVSILVTFLLSSPAYYLRIIFLFYLII